MPWKWCGAWIAKFTVTAPLKMYFILLVLVTHFVAQGKERTVAGMGIVWYILGLISGVILTAVVSCTIVSGEISREEEIRELEEKR